MSSHHPEAWQPSWSVRTAIVALIAFMPTPGQGALGSLVGEGCAMPYNIPAHMEEAGACAQASYEMG